MRTRRATALLVCLACLGATPALSASTAPPTDPQNLQPSAGGPLTPRSSVYAKGSTTRHMRRKHVSSQDVERQDFGRTLRK